MAVNVRYYRMYNVGNNKKSSRAKKYQIGLNHNSDWVSLKYPNWDQLPHSISNIMF